MIDFSIATEYTFQITDPNGSQTLYGYRVVSNIPSLTLDADIASTLIQDFCGHFGTDTRCPDGALLSPMILSESVDGIEGKTTTVADGVKKFDIHMKPRDRYGNALTSGQLEIQYDTPIQLIQTTDSPYFSALSEPAPFVSSVPGDAIIHGG